MNRLNELNQLDKRTKMPKSFIRCVDCGKMIENNHNKIQNHFLDFHSLWDQSSKRDKSWTIRTSTIR